eukprot:14888858-Ditylum_brightwellii.AAC.1
MVSSSRGYHLVQIVDVMVNVRKAAKLRPLSDKKKAKAKKLPGILGGALSDEFSAGEEKKDLTYKVETMGCQMNMADSERMEGQLQSLGIRPLGEEEEKGGAHPDLIVLNTCSIRDRAEQKVYS